MLVWAVAHAGNAASAADNAVRAPAADIASLSRSSVSASADGEAMLTVDSPGRFSIRAQSRTGVALQLVDMIAGPGELAGEAGVRDGRLDVLLDKGTYKIRTVGAAAMKRWRGKVASIHRLGPTRASAPPSISTCSGR